MAEEPKLNRKEQRKRKREAEEAAAEASAVPEPPIASVAEVSVPRIGDIHNIKPKKERASHNPFKPLAEDELRKKIFHVQKILLASAKKAQAFERKRLLKKIGDLKKKTPDSPLLPSLEAEFSELPSINLSILTSQHIHTKLSKIHLMTSYPLLAAALPFPSTVPPSKTANRILSNKEFAIVVSGEVSRIRGIMDPEIKVEEKAKQKAAEKKAVKKERKKEKQEEKKAAMAETSTQNAASDGEVETEDGESDAGGFVDGNGGDESDADEARLATEAGFSSGDEEDGLEADSEEEEEDDDSTRASFSSGSVASTSAAPPPAKKSKQTPATNPPASQKPQKKKEIKTSTFLPSLNAGFTRGNDSDSEPELLSDDDMAPKKNRRGQRARKAIWEKKYGIGANHLKAEREKQLQLPPSQRSFIAVGNHRAPSTSGREGRTGIAAGSRPPVPEYIPGVSAPLRGGRGGARGGPSSRKGFNHPPPPSTSAPGLQAASAPAPKSGATSGGGGVHVSWELKKAQKEKEKAMISATKGKKIVFD